MSFGTEQAAQLTTLLGQYGSTATAFIKRSTGEVFDPVTSTTTGGTPVNLEILSAKLPMNKTMLLDERIRLSDTMLIMNNVVEPFENDLINVSNIDMRVIAIFEHKNAETVVGYKVACRG